MKKFMFAISIIMTILCPHLCAMEEEQNIFLQNKTLNEARDYQIKHYGISMCKFDDIQCKLDQYITQYNTQFLSSLEPYGISTITSPYKKELLRAAILSFDTATKPTNDSTNYIYTEVNHLRKKALVATLLSSIYKPDETIFFAAELEYHARIKSLKIQEKYFIMYHITTKQDNPFLLKELRNYVTYMIISSEQPLINYNKPLNISGF